MARKIKIKKKEELKKPDEFLSMSTRFLNYIKANEAKVIVVSIIVILVVIGASFFAYYVRNNEALGYQYLSNALEKENDIKAKKELLLKVKGMSFSSASKYASFYLAQIYNGEQNIAQAKTELEKVFSVKDTYFKGAAYVLMTDILLKEKRYDEALKVIETALKDVKKPFKDELLYRKAQLLEQKNNFTEANNIYKEILKSNSDFYLAKLVQQKVEN